MKIIFQGDVGEEGQLVCPITHLSFKFKKGEVIEVPDSLAQRAIEGGLWKRAYSITETVTTQPEE